MGNLRTGNKRHNRAIAALQTAKSAKTAPASPKPAKVAPARAKPAKVVKKASA